MISDVVERAKAAEQQLMRHGFVLAAETVKLQADEIERLRAEVERLREALKQLLGALEDRGVDLDPMSVPTPMIELLNTAQHHAIVQTARAALNGEDQ